MQSCIFKPDSNGLNAITHDCTNIKHLETVYDVILMQ